MEMAHLGLSIPWSLILYTLSSHESLNLFPFTAGRRFSVMAEQGIDLPVHMYQRVQNYSPTFRSSRFSVPGLMVRCVIHSEVNFIKGD